MNKFFIKILLVLIISLETGIIISGQSTNYYDKSDNVFFNPERGFSAARSSSLSDYFINSIKSKNISVVQRIYTIPQFRSSKLSADFLELVQKDFNTAREGGIKLVLRFSYTNNQNGEDAPLDTILTHISQLKPLFEKNYDVILYVEAGFIGAWGEWYYSTNNLNNTADRRTVLFALLEALPQKRNVVVRTPDYKRKIFESNLPLTLEEAYTGTQKSRTGAHNDCFLASETDYGTYISNDIEGDKSYLNLDNRFVPQGGETCCDCGFAGCENALTDLQRMHWSVLNIDYHPDVLNRWKTEGCFKEIEQKLGYRFVLLETTSADSLKPGAELNINLKISNEGFANPFNSRSLELILRDNSTNKKYRLITDADPRFWMSQDTVIIDITGGIPKNIAEGDYSLGIFLADPEPKLHDRVDYAIHLANENVWEDSTGYNIVRDIKISKKAESLDYTGENYFEPYFPNKGGSTAEIIIDGLFEDWKEIEKLDLPPLEESVGDVSNGRADLEDLWIAESEEEIYISYSLEETFSNNYFYHIFFDADVDTSTGYKSQGSFAGIDYMIENQILWKYSGEGGEWGWNQVKEIGFALGGDNQNRVEIALSKSDIESVSNFELIFNVNDNDENTDGDYAPDSYTNESYRFRSIITGIKEKSKILTVAPALAAYPNPFNSSVTFDVKINLEEINSIEIFNILGKRIKSFNKNSISNGYLTWNTSDQSTNLSSGIYFFILNTKYDIYSQKIVLLK